LGISFTGLKSFVTSCVIKKRVFMKRLFLLSICFFLVTATGFVYTSKNFQVAHVINSTPAKIEWDTQNLSLDDQKNLQEILAQRFIYLDEGGQSYVFISENKEYVLKFFKFQKFNPSPLVRCFPNIYPFKTLKEKHALKRKKKLFTVFNGYKIAYELHREKSGLIFVQLNPSSNLLSVKVVDKNQHEHFLSLNQIPFVIQKNGSMLGANLSKILKDSDLPEAKKRVEQLYELYLSEYEKGICDLDYGIMHNIGCTTEGNTFHLDVGKFIFDEKFKQPKHFKKHLNNVGAKLKSWFGKHYPKYSEELAQHVDQTFLLNSNEVTHDKAL
jgi:hypothetical protein